MNTTPKTPENEFDLVAVYTAEDAVGDGVLLHFSPATALEAGYKLPVLLTTAAHAAAVAWTRPGEWQSEDARFWDVLTVIRATAKAAVSEPGRTFQTYVLRVPNATPSGKQSTATTASRQQLVVTCEGYNLTGQACLIISLPGED